MSSADWSIGVGVLIFIISICFAIYFYLKYKKVSQVVFIASISTYIFAVFYAMDVFELSKNWILGVLVVSTILMMSVGKYFSKNVSSNRKK